MTSTDSAGSVIERTTCRVCGRSSLSAAMDLGEQCIAGYFPPRGASSVSARFPLELVRCDRSHDRQACGLLQLRHSIRSDLLYDAYWYRSGINRTMTENLHEIAAQAFEITSGLASGDVVLDIGCNDGTLLDGYEAIAPPGVEYLGIDPSDMSKYAVDKGYAVVNDLFTHAAFARRYPDRCAKIITSIAMFYDLESPVDFAQDVASCLTDDGVWVTEFSYMPTMLAMNSFDTVCHEHLEYYSFAVLERIFRSAGLEVVRVELNDVNGGSIRLFAGRPGHLHLPPGRDSGLEALRAGEAELDLDSAAPYAAFEIQARRIRDDLRTLLESLKEDGKIVHIYGASTKGNTTLQYCGIDRSLIEAAADRNPDKWGCETIGTGIPIISEEDSRARLPDYYLVLPWHFLDEMIDRERAFFDRGGKFILPLPEVRIVDGSTETR